MQFSRIARVPHHQPITYGGGYAIAADKDATGFDRSADRIDQRAIGSPDDGPSPGNGRPRVARDQTAIDVERDALGALGKRRKRDESRRRCPAEGARPVSDRTRADDYV